MLYCRRFFGLLLLLLLLSACKEKAADLPASFTAYDEVSFKLPSGWRADPNGEITEISGGFGFMSSDYAGLTYLRLHQGASFAVMGDWEPTQDAATALQVAFADNISNAKSIQVLGYKGTYAHGELEQGQGIGAVHVTYEIPGGSRQFVFILTVADEWKNFEPTFLKIIESLQLMG